MIFSVTTGFCFNYPNCVTDHARIAVYRARRPVTLAHLIEHRATDTDTGVGLETRALAGVVFTRDFEQADHAGLDQVIHLHTGRQTRQQVVGDALDQGRIALDKFVLAVARRLAVHAVTAGRH